jgi:hypothetical protein
MSLQRDNDTEAHILTKYMAQSALEGERADEAKRVDPRADWDAHSRDERRPACQRLF